MPQTIRSNSSDDQRFDHQVATFFRDKKRRVVFRVKSSANRESFPRRDPERAAEFMRHFAASSESYSRLAPLAHTAPFFRSGDIRNLPAGDIQSRSKLVQAPGSAAAPGVGYRAHSTAARTEERDQMYRNDLCTWLDVLSTVSRMATHRDTYIVPLPPPPPVVARRTANRAEGKQFPSSSSGPAAALDLRQFFRVVARR